MSEERVSYATDEVTQLRRQVAQLVDRLDAAFKTIDGFTDASSFQWGEYQRRIKELEAANARLEADNRRLRKLDAMPLDALRRYFLGTAYDETLCGGRGYSLPDYNEDAASIDEWLATLDGDA